MSSAAKRQVDEKTPDSRLKVAQARHALIKAIGSGRTTQALLRDEPRRSSPQGVAAQAERGLWQPDEMSV
jgi:hypothetical protein